MAGESCGLTGTAFGRDAVRMYAMEPEKFFVTTDPVTFSFTVDADKTGVFLQVDAPGAMLRGRRVAADPPR